MKTHRFAIAARDELWSLGGRRAMLESRLSHGEALTREREIDASDRADRELVERSESLLDALRARIAAIHDATVRLTASARRVDDHAIVESSMMTVSRGGVSIVTDTPDDLALLPTRPAQNALGTRPHALLWMNGSASVLLHEAAGHAAEHGAPAVAWPEWLRVHDEPDFAFDDIGEPARVADLLREAPAAFRRESFRDVPLRRMSRVITRQENAPFEVPDDAIEVLLVAGGHYEALTDEVSIFIARSRRGGEELAPFTLRAARADIARALAGARGEPLRYPGVVCSREGQELVVGSYAPVMLTVFG